MTCVLDGVQRAADYIDTDDLGPVVSIEANQQLIVVQIDPGHPGKSRVLRSWVDHLRRADLVMHQVGRNASVVQLDVQGWLDYADSAVVVYTTYRRDTERDQVNLITGTVDTAEPVVLLDQLAAREPSPTPNPDQGR